MNLISDVKNLLEKIDLTENYRGKAFVRNFNAHVDALFETSTELYDIDTKANQNLNFSNSVYWGCESIILEKLDDVSDPGVIEDLNNLEDLLYSKLVGKLGVNYHNGDRSWINKMLDMTVNNILLSVKFNYFSESKHYRNPWVDAYNILFENNLIYTFTDDVDNLKDLGLKIDRSESELVSENLIGVIGKGNKKRFATGYFRDLAALKNTLINILVESKHNSSNPITSDSIIKKIRDLNIKEKELTDGNIRNWLVTPLKRINRLGSNKDGFFVIDNEDDLVASYNSHLENFKGYYRTLEKHRKLGDHFGIPDAILDEHNLFIQKLNIKNELDNN